MRLVQRLFLALVAAQIVVGLVWTVAELGDLPTYGDSAEYLRLAKRFELDAYRGIAYPALLAADFRLSGTRLPTLEVLQSADPGRGWLLPLQLLQLAVSAACIAWFLRVFVRPSLPAGGARNRVVLVLLFLALFIDPLVAHFNLAVLSDGLALSACLAFAAALAQFGLGSSHRTRAGVVLFLACLVAAGLRVEKRLVLALATVSTLACWTWLERRGARDERAVSRPRMLQCAAIVLAAIMTVPLVERGVSHTGVRWPVEQSLLHQRVIFPHLAEVYDELPGEARAHLSRQDAADYDRNINRSRQVIEAATRGDAELRASLTRELASVVWRERRFAIVLDVLKDTVENVAASVSFYLRLGVIAFADFATFDRFFNSDGTWGTVERFSEHHPGLSRVYLGTSALVFVLALVLALGRRNGARARSNPDARLAWVPVVCLVLVNALAFALVADLVHVRYVLFAHVALLAFVYRRAVGPARGSAGGSRAERAAS